MKVLFLTLSDFNNPSKQGIYSDLLATFRDYGHQVTIVYARQEKTGLPTELEEKEEFRVLGVQTGNLQKCSLMEKGVSQLKMAGQFKAAMKRFGVFGDCDLILYATPPTTLCSLISELKEYSGAKTYLLLKDIFPQNSLDLGMLSKSGAKGVIYQYFKHTERTTYEVSDFIGCMSEANRKYLIEHEPWLDPAKTEVNPNSLIPKAKKNVDKVALRQNFGLPIDAKIFAYGGNLGKPQAIDYLVRVLRGNEQRTNNCFFTIAGSGTERYLLEEYIKKEQPVKAKLFPQLSREDFDSLLSASDCGLVLLDNRFTIPNFPSRVLSYAQAGIPYMAATDSATDIGAIAETNIFGLGTDSINENHLLEICEQFTKQELEIMGANARTYFEKNWTAECSYETIMRHFDD